jgi:hypothetical protein
MRGVIAGAGSAFRLCAPCKKNAPEEPLSLRFFRSIFLGMKSDFHVRDRGAKDGGRIFGRGNSFVFRYTGAQLEIFDLRRNFMALLLLGFLSGAVSAQDQAPALLVHAAQCLATKKLLPTSGVTSLSLGYWIDATSYPGKKVLYVVATSGSNHSAGRVFSIFFRERRHRQLFDIDNSAIFVRSNDARGDVSFVAPPLGGADSEGSFVSAIQQLEGQPRFTVSGAQLTAPLTHTTCKSYTDAGQS